MQESTKENIIKGYKAFDKNMRNRYGRLFEEGQTYKVEGALSFGNDGNGFHFCKNLEDTLRYVPATEEEVTIARVASLGEVYEASDEFYGFYNMYSARIIKIEKFLSREEIIIKYLDNSEHSVLRFLQLFKLSEEEIPLFKIRYVNNTNIQNAISYYQEGDKETYEKYYRGYAYSKK